MAFVPIVLRKVDPFECRKTQFVRGIPTMWAFDIGTIQFDLTANADTTVVYRYQSGIELSDANPTNWLLTNAPDLYFAAAMVELSKFQKDTDGAARWGGERNSLIEQVGRLIANNREPDVLYTDMPRREFFNINRGW
jgi:hypothetical protein